MVSFLLFISFVLHACAFFWIFQLKKERASASEMENLLALYMEEMKQENTRLIGLLEEKAEQADDARPQVAETTEVSETETDLSKPEPEKAATPGGAIAGKSVEPPYEPSFEAKVLALSKQGLNHEQIAKQLGRGKGEVELLLRLLK
ncbi:MAG TPA: hypothetical protein VFK44_11995 [Bacillales bacterium]|nr:hypothetical protein [Bacillales bacterium]